jgi:hypothetical protein
MTVSIDMRCSNGVSARQEPHNKAAVTVEHVWHPFASARLEMGPARDGFDDEDVAFAVRHLVESHPMPGAALDDYTVRFRRSWCPDRQTVRQINNGLQWLPNSMVRISN